MRLVFCLVLVRSVFSFRCSHKWFLSVVVDGISPLSTLISTVLWLHSTIFMGGLQPARLFLKLSWRFSNYSGFPTVVMCLYSSPAILGWRLWYITQCKRLLFVAAPIVIGVLVMVQIVAIFAVFHCFFFFRSKFYRRCHLASWQSLETFSAGSILTFFLLYPY